MKDIEKMSEREMREEIRQLRTLLAVARCPDTACLMGTVTGKQISEGVWEQHECQWCHEQRELLGELHSGGT